MLIDQYWPPISSLSKSEKMAQNPFCRNQNPNEKGWNIEHYNHKIQYMWSSKSEMKEKSGLFYVFMENFVDMLVHLTLQIFN